jgi:hypothetical protein
VEQWETRGLSLVFPSFPHSDIIFLAMGQHIDIDEEYYCDRPYPEAPWTIHSTKGVRDTIVGYYQNGLVTWRDTMNYADNQWLEIVIKEKVT